MERFVWVGQGGEHLSLIVCCGRDEMTCARVVRHSHVRVLMLVAFTHISYTRTCIMVSFVASCGYGNAAVRFLLLVLISD